jgi:uncharacterized RDD family membrane protein YckC
VNTATLQIKTPEGIVFSQTLASPIARFLATLIDIGCIWVLLILVQLLVGIAMVVSPDFAAALGILLYFSVTIFYSIILEWWWRGQTIGKRVLRLRVVDAEGMRLELNQIVIRNLLRMVDLLPAFYASGGMAAFLSRKAQRLGDLAANTVVIRIPKISQPDLDQLLPDKFNSLRAFPHLEARLRQRVTPAEAAVALQALMRRDEFEPAARVQLFSELASHFKSKVEFPQDASEGIADEQYVRNVADVLYRTNSRKKSREPIPA